MDTLARLTIPLVAWRATEKLSADHVMAWAENLLVAGFDSPALRRLAGMSLDGDCAHRVEDLLPLFARALEELEFPDLSVDEAVDRYEALIAERILSGELNPREGARRIYGEVVVPLVYPRRLVQWANVDAGRTIEGDCPLPESEIDDAIREVARRALRRRRSADTA